MHRAQDTPRHRVVALIAFCKLHAPAELREVHTPVSRFLGIAEPPPTRVVQHQDVALRAGRAGIAFAEAAEGEKAGTLCARAGGAGVLNPPTDPSSKLVSESIDSGLLVCQRRFPFGRLVVGGHSEIG